MNLLKPQTYPDQVTPTKPILLTLLIRLLLVIGIGLGIFSTWSRYFIFTDGTVYAALGKNLADGVGLRYCGATHLFYPPGYPLAISVLYLAFADAEFCAHILSILAYWASIWVVSRLAWRIRPTLLFTVTATAIVTFHPLMILNAGLVMPEALLVCTVLASAYCCWKLASDSRAPFGWWILWGGLGGFAYLIRADGILYWPIQALFILIYRKENLIRNVAYCILSVATLILTIFPYLWLIRSETGHWQLSTKTSIILEYSRQITKAANGKWETQFTSTLGSDGKSFALDRSKETFSSFILGNPREAAARVVYNLQELLKQKGITFGWVDILFFFILWIRLGRSILSAKSLFILLHLCPILLFLLLYIDPRFLLVFIPFIALGIGRVVEVGWEFLSPFMNRRFWWIPVGMILGMIGVVGMVSAPRMGRTLEKIVNAHRNLPLEHKAMGLWMKDHLPITPTTKITHRNPWVSFYAQGCHARTPFFPPGRPEETLKQLVQWCRDTNVQYLLVDERMTKPYMPSLAFLLDETKKYSGLRYRHTSFSDAVSGKKPKIVLYEIITETE